MVVSHLHRRVILDVDFILGSACLPFGCLHRHATVLQPLADGLHQVLPAVIDDHVIVFRALATRPHVLEVVFVVVGVVVVKVEHF